MGINYRSQKWWWFSGFQIFSWFKIRIVFRVLWGSITGLKNDGCSQGFNYAHGSKLGLFSGFYGDQLQVSKKMLVLRVLTLMLLVANLVKTKFCKRPEKWLKPWHMGTHLLSAQKELSSEYQQDRVQMILKNHCVLVAAALEGLNILMVQN